MNGNQKGETNECVYTLFDCTASNKAVYEEEYQLNSERYTGWPVCSTYMHDVIEKHIRTYNLHVHTHIQRLERQRSEK